MPISYVQIQQVLNDEDIEGLLRIGAPRDEYEPESQLIAQAIEQTCELTEDHLTAVVENTWRERFGPFSEEQLRARHSAFRRVAQHILIAQQ